MRQGPRITIIGAAADAKAVGDFAAVLGEQGATVRTSKPGLGNCDLCEKHDELRPYGPNGERICYDCGKRNPEATARRMGHVLFGKPL